MLLAHSACEDYGSSSSSADLPCIQTSLLRITEGRLMSAQSPSERNVCRFDGERGTDEDFHFFVLACDDAFKFHHCRGLLLRRLGGELERYERVGTGWATDEIWHGCPETVITLV